MRDATITASPFSYSKTCDTSRPRGAGFRTARRTGLGRTFFDRLFRTMLRAQSLCTRTCFSKTTRMRRRRCSPSWFWRVSRRTHGGVRNPDTRQDAGVVGVRHAHDVWRLSRARISLPKPNFQSSPRFSDMRRAATTPSPKNSSPPGTGREKEGLG